jgi:thiol-disulfide isomerase/thioredoxin
MKTPCCPTVASLLAAFTMFATAAETATNADIDKLAKDGYWVKTGASYKAAMDLLNKPAPALKLTNWHGKEPEQAGKIVLIDFWATWCGPCIAQIPHANEIAKKYADKGVVVFGACCPEGAETMAKVAKDKNMEYPTGKLDKREVESWKVGFWPTYAIVDRAGKLRAVGLEPGRVEPFLDALVAEQPAK